MDLNHFDRIGHRIGRVGRIADRGSGNLRRLLIQPRRPGEAFSTRSTPPVYGRVETVPADAVADEGTKETYFSARVVLDPEDVPRIPQPLRITAG